MVLESWLPIGFLLPDGTKTKQVKFGGPNWQIVDTQSGRRALLVAGDIYQKWIDSGLLEPGTISIFAYGKDNFGYISSPIYQQLCPIGDSNSPNTKAEALAFTLAFRETRSVDQITPLQDAIYIEKLSRLLPTYSISSKTDDDIVLGYWLTGGAHVSATSFRRLRQMMSWLEPSALKEVIEAAGYEVSEITSFNQGHSSDMSARSGSKEDDKTKGESITRSGSSVMFQLAGRPELEAFFNEHIIDILQNRDRYKALGIEFASAIALHGPPGCGKTYAVEQLVEFLGWPSFSIDSSSVASPYIHETSKKVAEVFDKAIDNAPAVLVIDEMEAFLADREMGSGHHRVEEVAEFLRRIPEAVKSNVLIIAMTNRIEIIDPAILRRGRFDHVLKVGFANESEIMSLLDKLVSHLPKDESIDVAFFAKELAGRPLSDVSFVVREGARLAAKSGKDKLDHESLKAALDCAPSREREGSTPRRIGFV